MSTIIIEKSGKSDQDFENIAWVLNARSDDKTRPNLMDVYSDKGLIVCTDGARLHTYTPTREIPDGLYTIKTATKKLIVLEIDNDNIYPDYERAFPRCEFKHTMYCNGNKNPFIHTIYHDFADDECSFNLDFLVDVYMHDSHLSIAKNPGLKPLCLYDDLQNRAALVMPLRNN